MKKMLALLLAALMLSAAGCSNPESGSSSDAAQSAEVSAVAEAAAPEEEAEEVLKDSLPEKDFGGADAAVWGDVSTWGNFYTVEDNADVVDEAVYKRNLTVEDRFNVKFSFSLEADGGNGWRSDAAKNALIASIMAGDGAVDLYTSVAVYSTNAQLQGCFRNLMDAEYLDFAQPWWMPYLNNVMTIAGKRFCASGYFDMPTLVRTGVTFFGTQMVEDFALGSLYDLVDSGEWTYEKMISMAETVSADLDGDGKYTEADRYGIMSTWDCMGFLYCGTGFDIYTHNDDGTLTATPIDEGIVDANAMLYTLLNDSPNLYYSGYTKGQSHNETNMKNIFVDHRALFMVAMISYCSESVMREMGDYGILPIPKFTDDQPLYGTSSSHFISAIPVDVKNAEMSEILLEALQYESFMTVRPAYYDVALSHKYLGDPNSVRMLDLIFSNTHTDTDYLYSSWGSGGGQLVGFLGVHDNYTSFYKSQQKMLEKRAENLFKAYADIGS